MKSLTQFITEEQNFLINSKINSTVKSSKSNVDVISYETFNLILDRLKTYYYIPFYIAWYTGARIGEITALTWNDIDFENNTITFDKTTVELDGGGVEFQIPKTPNAIRTILVSKKLLDMLKDWKDKQQKYAVELMKEEPDLEEVFMHYYKEN